MKETQGARNWNPRLEKLAAAGISLFPRPRYLLVLRANGGQGSVSASQLCGDEADLLSVKIIIAMMMLQSTQ